MNETNLKIIMDHVTIVVIMMNVNTIVWKIYKKNWDIWDYSDSGNS